MQQLAEQAGTHHVQQHQFFASVADVLQHHAVPAGGLAGLHERPGLVQGQRRRNLDQGVLAGAHGRHRHDRVQLPGRGNEHGVDVRALDQGAPGLVAAAVHGGLDGPSLVDQRLHPGQALRVDVGHRDQACTLYVQQAARQEAAALPDADDAESHLRERRCRQCDGPCVAGRSPVGAPRAGAAGGQGSAADRRPQPVPALDVESAAAGVGSGAGRVKRKGRQRGRLFRHEAPPPNWGECARLSACGGCRTGGNP